MTVDGSAIYFRADEMRNHCEKAYARWKHREREIHIYYETWTGIYRNPEFLAWTINHEVLHAMIDDILEEDNLWKKNEKGVWNHWPFACGLDELFGFSFFDIYVLPKIASKRFYVLTNCLGDQEFLGLDFARHVLAFRDKEHFIP